MMTHQVEPEGRSPQVTEAGNIQWFADNHNYVESQSRLEHYQHVKRSVERELVGVGRLLDIGNGGFFNYDTSLVDHVTAVDLFLTDGPGPLPNSTFRRGSLLELPFEADCFDCILLQNVFHHVTGRNVEQNHRNLDQGLRELHRCLAPAGKVVIIESTVGRIFYQLERALFRPALALKRGGHPVTFQFTPRHIIGSAEKAGLAVEELTYVPTGSYVLQLGYKWPSALTPVKPIKLILRKSPAGGQQRSSRAARAGAST
jgi:SAM-dependent methyltransferase